MFKAFYGMQFNPFTKELDVKHHYKSNDFKQANNRLDYLTQVKGIALFTGEPGAGKSFTLRSFISRLNKNLYKTVYIPISTLTVNDFYKALAMGLGQFPKSRKIELFTQLQDSIMSYSEKNITPVIIIDEAQFISKSILNDLRIIFNFNMDSKNPAIVTLAGQPPLVTQLNRQPHEALRQRIILNYAFKGLSLNETKFYVASRLELTGLSEPIFTDDALELIHSSSNGLVRKINSIVRMTLLDGTKAKVKVIDAEFIYKALNELEITS